MGFTKKQRREQRQYHPARHSNLKKAPRRSSKESQVNSPGEKKDDSIRPVVEEAHPVNDDPSADTISSNSASS